MAPRTITMTASVAMNGLIDRRVINVPLRAPLKLPITAAPAIAAPMPWGRRTTAATPPIAITAPTERSNPPDIITIVRPATTMPSVAIDSVRVCKFPNDQKPSTKLAKTSSGTNGGLMKSRMTTGERMVHAIARRNHSKGESSVVL